MALARWRALPRQISGVVVYALAILLVLFSGEGARIDWWRGGVQDGPEDGRNSVQQLFAVTPPFTREQDVEGAHADRHPEHDDVLQAVEQQLQLEDEQVPYEDAVLDTDGADGHDPILPFG